MVLDGARGHGVTYPLALVATTLFGRGALDGGAVAVIVGAALHLAVGAAWGALFAWVLPARTSGPAAATVGALFSYVIFFTMLTVTRFASPIFYEEVHGGTLLVAHIVYGLGLGLTVPAIHRVEHHHPADTVGHEARPNATDGAG